MTITLEEDEGSEIKALMKKANNLFLLGQLMAVK